MKELQVTVQQTPGVVHWNFDELKAQLQEEMSTYETAVYTDDNISEAKGDLAMLRKLRKSVEDRRKEIKKKCLEPYEPVEVQAKELTALIDKPIGLINEKVTEFDTKKREERKNSILEYMNEKFSTLPDVIGQRLKFKCYDPHWENASTSAKEWKTSIDTAADTCRDDIAKMNETIDAEFLPEAMKIYEKNLKITEAESAFNQYLQHKVKILEAEQRRKEEEARRQREAQERAIREAEVRARAEEAERIRKEQEAARKAQIEQEHVKAENVPNMPEESVHEPVAGPQCEVIDPFASTPVPQPELETPYVVLRISGTKQQIEKVKGYAKYAGATVEVLEEV